MSRMKRKLRKPRRLMRFPVASLTIGLSDGKKSKAYLVKTRRYRKEQPLMVNVIPLKRNPLKVTFSAKHVGKIKTLEVFSYYSDERRRDIIPYILVSVSGDCLMIHKSEVKTVIEGLRKYAEELEGRGELD